MTKTIKRDEPQVEMRALMTVRLRSGETVTPGQLFSCGENEARSRVNAGHAARVEKPAMPAKPAKVEKPA